MANLKSVTHYPGLDYAGSELKRFSKAGTLYTILLYNGKIVHFESVENSELNFDEWLKNHRVIDINS